MKHLSVDFHECEAHRATREFKPNLWVLHVWKTGSCDLGRTLPSFKVDEKVLKTRCYLIHVNTRKENDSTEIFHLVICCHSVLCKFYFYRVSTPETVSSTNVSNICTYNYVLYLWSFFAADGVRRTCINTSFANCLHLPLLVLIIATAWVFQGCAEYRWINNAVSNFF